MRRIFIAIVLFSFCGGCASLPSKEDIEAFSTATSNSASVVKTAVSAQEQIAADQDEQHQVDAYMRGRLFAAYPLPETAKRLISKDQLDIRLSALRDLQAYAKALGQAADQGTVDQLEASAEKLVTSVGALAAAVPGASPIIAPAAQLVGHSVGYAYANAYVQKVLDVVKDTDPTIKQLVGLLKEDLGPLSTDLEVQAGIYGQLREAELGTIRKDPKVSRAELYSAYMLARSDIKARYALGEAAEPVGQLLQSIYDTHHALAVGSPDLKLTITRMSTLTKDVASVIGAVKKEASQ